MSHLGGLTVSFDVVNIELSAIFLFFGCCCCPFSVFVSWSFDVVLGVHVATKRTVFFGMVMRSLSSNRKTSPFIRITLNDAPAPQYSFESTLEANLANGPLLLEREKRQPCFAMLCSYE